MPDMPISITIDSPQDRDEIVLSSPEVLVRGSISNPLGGETMVIVNGTPSFIYENRFIVSGVSLTAGTTLYTIDAIGEFGNKGNQASSKFIRIRKAHIHIRSDITGVSPIERTQ